MNPSPAIDPDPVDSASRAASLRSETRYRRTITWSIVLIGMLLTAAVGYFFFRLDLLSGQLGTLVAVSVIPFLLIAQIIRYRQRLTLRTLLITVTILACVLAWFGRQWSVTHEESTAVSTLLERGAKAEYGVRKTTGDGGEYFKTEGGWYLPVWVRDTLGASYFSNVREIQVFYSSAVNDEDLALLRNIRSLEALDLSSSDHITAAGVARLPLIPGVQRLTLRTSMISDASAERLSHFADMKALHVLDRDGKVVDLRPLEQLTQVEHLFLNPSRFSEGDMKALARMPELRLLRIDTNFNPGPNTQTGFGELGQSQTINSLLISSAYFTDADLSAMANMGALEVLHLVNTQVTADAVRTFRAARPNVRVSVSPPIPGLEN